MQSPQSLSELVTKIDVTLELLMKVVDVLSQEVKEIKEKQHYWAGVVAAVGFFAMMFGGLMTILVQHFIK